MDYKGIMDEDFNYPEFYNQVMETISFIIKLYPSSIKKLEEKRKFGLEKYGEYSFQANFKNSMTSPSEEHLEEELVDAINYVMHSIFKTKVNYLDNDILEKEIEIGRKLVKLYYEVLDLHEVKYA